MITIGVFQKILGVLACIVSTLVMIFTGEGTQACMFLPLGIYLIFTSSIVVNHEKKEDEEADD